MVAYIIQYSKLQNNQDQNMFELSNDAFNCLNCRDFYEITIKKSYEPDAVGLIISRLSQYNLNFTQMISYLMTKMHYTMSVDVAITIMSICSQFLNIKDNFVQQRYNFILGLPQLKIDQYSDQFYVDKIEDSLFYFSNLTSSDELNDRQPFLEAFYDKRNNWPNIVIQSLKYLLETMDENDDLFRYIV